MSVTWSINGNIFKAIEGDTVKAKYFKALFWRATGATVGTTLLEIVEKNTSGHLVYAMPAEQEQFCVPIPMPNGAVEFLYIKDLDAGYVFGYVDEPD